MIQIMRLHTLFGLFNAFFWLKKFICRTYFWWHQQHQNLTQNQENLHVKSAFSKNIIFIGEYWCPDKTFWIIMLEIFQRKHFSPFWPTMLHISRDQGHQSPKHVLNVRPPNSPVLWNWNWMIQIQETLNSIFVVLSAFCSSCVAALLLLRLWGSPLPAISQFLDWCPSLFF